MNPSTLVAISGYAGDQKQIEFLMPHYLHHRCPVVILSPEDAPIKWTSRVGTVTSRVAGLRGWIGPHTLVRQKKFLEVLLSYPHEHFLLNDADSLCLSPELPEYLYRASNVFWSNEVMDTNPAPSLLPKIALQPPYFFSRHTLAQFLEHADKPATSYTAPSPEGWMMPVPTDCIDHWMLQVVRAAAIEHRNFTDGASFETGSEHGCSTMVEHVGRMGKRFIHSVKTEHALRRLVAARETYLKKKP